MDAPGLRSITKVKRAGPPLTRVSGEGSSSSRATVSPGPEGPGTYQAAAAASIWERGRARSKMRQSRPGPQAGARSALQRRLQAAVIPNPDRSQVWGGGCQGVKRCTPVAEIRAVGQDK